MRFPPLPLFPQTSAICLGFLAAFGDCLLAVWWQVRSGLEAGYTCQGDQRCRVQGAGCYSKESDDDCVNSPEVDPWLQFPRAAG